MEKHGSVVVRWTGVRLVLALEDDVILTSWQGRENGMVQVSESISVRYRHLDVGTYYWRRRHLVI